MTALVSANLITDVLYGVGEGIETVAKSALDTGRDFEEAMSIVASTMAISVQEIENGSGSYAILEQAALDAGKATKYSAQEAADALNYLALAGYDAEKASAALPDVLNLAAAGALDLGYASDLVTDSMAALCLDTEELTNFIDEMAKTSQKSNTDIAQLGEAILTVGGTAKQLAGGTVELNTVLGILADNGIKGSEGGTALRNMLNDLTNPTDKAAKCMDNLGVSVYDACGNIRPLNEVFKDLEQALDGVSDEERNTALGKIFDVRNLKSAEAMIANCGARYNELAGYISQATGAASQMAATMTNNLNGKVEELGGSLETLGIKVYDKFEEPLKEAVTTGIEGVDSLIDAMDGGRLGESFDHLAESFEHVTEEGVELATDVLPTVVDSAAWILDNGETLVSIVAGLATAKVSYKVATVAANTAQMLFNTTLNANPYVMVATVIMGVVGALGTLAITTKEVETEAAIMAEKLGNCAENMQSSRNSAGELVTELGAQKKYTNELKTELVNLNSQQTLDANQKKRIAEIVATLNSKYPGLNLCIDEQTGKINDNTGAWKENIEKMEEAAAVQAMQEKVSEMYAEQADAAYELWKVEQELVDIKKQKCDLEVEQAELYSKFTDAEAIMSEEEVDRYREVGEILQQLSSEENTLSEATANMREENSAYQESIDSLTNFMEEQYGVMESGQETIAATAEANDQLASSVADASDSVSDSTVAMGEAYKHLYGEVYKVVEESMNLFSKFEIDSDVTTQSILDNMESQVEGLTSWGDNLESLANRTDVAVNQGLLYYLAEMGPQGAAYVKAFTEMSAEELEKANELFAESVTLPDDIATQVATSYTQVGQSAGEGLYTGIYDQNIIDKIKAAEKEVCEGTITTAGDIFDVSEGPSKEFQELGGSTDEGLALGIKEGKQDVVDTESNLCTEVVKESENRLKSTSFTLIGKQVTEGLKQGIASGKSAVIEAMRELCTETIATAKSELDIHSPSRKTYWLGEMLGAGLIQGWQSSVKNISAVIANDLPMFSVQQASGRDSSALALEGGNRYNIEQNINIYSPVEDMIETTRQFQEAQKEAARDW